MNSLRNSLCFLLGAATTAAFVVLLLPPAPRLYTIADIGMRKLSTVAGKVEDDGLAELLRSASMEDKTVILAFTNEAHALPGSLLQIMLESIRTGVRTQPLLKHLVVVATDAKGQERCLRMHRLCYLLAGNGTGSAAELMFYDKDYVDMMWARNRFLSRVLALGYAFLLTDLDILWFRNPLLRIPVGADITLGCDNFFGDNPYDLDKNINTGLLYTRPTRASVAFFRDWYEARTRFPGENDQVVFREMKHELVARHGMTVQVVDTSYFSNACESWKKFNFHEMCTFHTACIHGLQDKTDRLNAVLQEWRQYQAQQLLLGTNSTALTY